MADNEQYTEMARAAEQEYHTALQPAREAWELAKKNSRAAYEARDSAKLRELQKVEDRLHEAYKAAERKARIVFDAKCTEAQKIVKQQCI